MTEDLKAPISTPKILKDKPLKGEGGVSKIIGHNIQFKAHDGSYHSTPEELQQANETHFQATHRYKSSVLGREYPATTEGAEQMRKDEAAYWERQKIPQKKI